MDSVELIFLTGIVGATIIVIHLEIAVPTRLNFVEMTLNLLVCITQNFYLVYIYHPSILGCDSFHKKTGLTLHHLVYGSDICHPNPGSKFSL